MSSELAYTLDARALETELGASMPGHAALEALESLAETFVRHPKATILPERAATVTLLGAMLGGGDLELRGTIGQGGMGIVRLALQTSLGREVAAKTLRPDRRSPEAQAQLAREAWVTGALEHPNIVPVHDIRIEEDGTPVVVLKRIEGDPWDELLAEPKRIDDRFFERDPTAWHLRVLLSVCKALELAHERDIVHRDIKPANVMIGRHGEVYVVDWGVAATLDDGADPRLPRVDERIVGTPAYMAPEMARGAPDQVSERTDLYLLGATLFELLAGRPPHEGEGIMQVLGSILVRDVEVPEGAPEELAAICRRAMARDPAARFESVGAFRRALEDHLEHRSAISIATRGEEELRALEERIEAGEDADAVQRSFGECRFAFQHALSIWAGSSRARRGLDDALVVMARWELARGEAQVAHDLLGEAVDVPPDLRGDVERALARVRAERRLLDEIEAKRRAMDPRVGRRQRIAFSVMLAAAWVLGPIVAMLRTYVFDRPQERWELALWPWGMALLFGGLAWAFRGALLRTAINRRVMFVFVSAMIAMGLSHLGMMQLGLGLAEIQSLDFFLYALFAAMLVPTVDRRFAFSTIVFLAAFYGSTARPEWRYFALLGANSAVLLNVLWVWPPWRAVEEP